MKSFSIYLVTLAVIGLWSCSVNKSQSQLSEIDLKNELSNYEAEIIDLRKARLAKLLQPKGWLAVNGLFWLKEGINAIGGSSENDIVFPNCSTETIGAYQKKGKEIFFGKVEGIEVKSNNLEYDGGPVILEYPPTILNHKALYWYLIERGQKIGIRLLDSLNSNRLNFKGLDYYAPDQKFQVMANVIQAEINDTVSITNVLGQQNDYPIAAYLNFTLGEQFFSLIALDEGQDEYFVIFNDQTTGSTTYGGGRFVYPKKPCDTCEQRTIIDFNTAINPPCAFTDFATCPLPPEQNKLKLKIEAGEKKYGNH